jgi:hypothetical protein
LKHLLTLVPRSAPHPRRRHSSTYFKFKSYAHIVQHACLCFSFYTLLTLPVFFVVCSAKHWILPPFQIGSTLWQVVATKLQGSLI